MALGMQRTAPAHVVRRFEECSLLERVNDWLHTSYTLEELRHMPAGDVAFLREYLIIRAQQEEKRAANRAASAGTKPGT